jgi:hypothetical protein
LGNGTHIKIDKDKRWGGFGMKCKKFRVNAIFERLSVFIYFKDFTIILLANNSKLYEIADLRGDPKYVTKWKSLSPRLKIPILFDETATKVWTTKSGARALWHDDPSDIINFDKDGPELTDLVELRVAKLWLKHCNQSTVNLALETKDQDPEPNRLRVAKGDYYTYTIENPSREVLSREEHTEKAWCVLLKGRLFEIPEIRSGEEIVIPC